MKKILSQLNRLNHLTFHFSGSLSRPVSYPRQLRPT
nr:MAG TPA: hypothetical protein [Caudoviricetes sp.]